jgi:hypothetical protein
MAKVGELLDSLARQDDHSPQVGLVEEWQIATDGLFGPAGVLGCIARSIAAERFSDGRARPAEEQGG